MNSRFTRITKKLGSILIAITVVVFLCINIKTEPFNIFDGAIWFDRGAHYVSQGAINELSERIVAPKELQLEEQIAETTPSCDTIGEGFCKQESVTSPDGKNIISYTYKILVKKAVEYQAAVPDKREVVSYCTLCNDGTFSPSCAVGRGACSWHGGVAQYNVAQYRITLGTPEVKAQPALYSYEIKSYRDSPLYVSPEKPSLSDIIQYSTRNRQ